MIFFQRLVFVFFFWRWCREDARRDAQGKQLLTQELKQLAFCTATGKHLAIFDVTASAYQLDGDDKEQFVPNVRQFLGHGRFKDVSEWVILFRLLPGLGKRFSFGKEKKAVLRFWVWTVIFFTFRDSDFNPVPPPVRAYGCLCVQFGEAKWAMGLSRRTILWLVFHMERGVSSVQFWSRLFAALRLLV